MIKVGQTRRWYDSGENCEIVEKLNEDQWMAKFQDGFCGCYSTETLVEDSFII